MAADQVEANHLLTQGDTIGGIRMLDEACAQVARVVGEGSPAYAAALFKLGLGYVRAGDIASAIAVTARAAAIPTATAADEKERLTYRLNLGQLRTLTGDLARAEVVLRANLEERAAFYGTDHPGYAFAQVSLAEVLLRRGHPAQAVALLDAAETICRHHDNPHSQRVIAVQLLAASAGRSGVGEALARYDALPVLPRRSALREFVNCLRLHPTTYALDALEHLLPELVRLDAAMFRDDFVGSGIRISRTLADHDAEVRWARRMVADCAEHVPMHVEALQAEALALDHAGDAAGAVTVYRRAEALAADSQLPGLQSQILRNHGLLLSQRGQRDAATSLLEEALVIARRSADEECLGSALAALGIHLQHDGDLVRAKVLLGEASARLSVTHAHFLSAQSHYDAIVHERSCGCGDPMGALAAAVHRHIAGRMPPGLLDHVVVEPGPDSALSARAITKRPPTAAEQHLLDLVLRQALIDVRANH